MRLFKHTSFTAFKLAFSLALVGASATSVAETVAIPLGQQGKAWQVETPRTGVTKEAVEAQYGSPLDTQGPVGEPPITTWEYEQFTVYFEYNHVIHAVVKHNANK